ncbi:hypothetical protein [Chryseobacterium gleum]|uniref:hypothetical protein n=1 Tax=Chryseobacterium gleum TaxID=250 RepID=UPI00241ED9AB|nr:hypothetical protein [Chryseobacterium gleum]
MICHEQKAIAADSAVACSGTPVHTGNLPQKQITTHTHRINAHHHEKPTFGRKIVDNTINKFFKKFSFFLSLKLLIR